MTEANLARAGRILSRHVRVPDPEISPAVARVRLIEALSHRTAPSRFWLLAVAATAVLAVVAGLVWLQIREPIEDAVAFTVGADRTPGRVGAHVAPDANEPLELRFSEGSVVELQPAARARVTQTSSRGAVVLVETGRARVEVVHGPGAKWSVLAGPYTIEVRGTSFEVAFEPASQTLEVVMRSGVVSVFGPGIASPLEISGAQRFVHSASDMPPAAARSGHDPPTAPVAEAAAVADSETPGTSHEPRSLVGAGGARSGAAASADPGLPEPWNALVARGEYRVVIESAERQGIDRTLASAGPGELVALASAARFSGRGALASEAYLALRRRFPGSSQAASAAFLLGRMAEGGNPNAAIAWYDSYVAEAPAGSFVAEALGRKMIALKRGGNVGAAQTAAHTYLQRFPGGPYAGVAREMTTP